jgi:hypothetical protein
MKFLSDKRVLGKLNGGLSYPGKNKVQRVRLYLMPWANMLDERQKPTQI